MTKIYNRIEQKEKRQALRRKRTKAEVILWQRLRAGQVGGWKFRQQYSIGPYIVDFYCPQLKLAIEIDGASHEGSEAEIYDANRQAFIESYDIRFLRFTNQQIYEQINAVVENIALRSQELANK
ncbi:MAG TPA: endonuclease domain-containing protein [Abditibacteriaceae bacterium]|jgi:very-short-patch-repair endonuclease